MGFGLCARRNIVTKIAFNDTLRLALKPLPG